MRVIITTTDSRVSLVSSESSVLQYCKETVTVPSLDCMSTFIQRRHLEKRGIKIIETNPGQQEYKLNLIISIPTNAMT